jgi:hypothetical protein
MSGIIPLSTLADVMLFCFLVLPLCTLGVLIGCFALFLSSLPSAVSLAVNGGFSRVEPLVVAVEAMGLLFPPHHCFGAF